jgi:hypothetical protein
VIAVQSYYFPEFQMYLLYERFLLMAPHKPDSNAMAGKSSSSSTLLIILVLIITFPFWLAVGGVMIGVLAAIFGVIIGVIGALFGGLFALIALPFKLMFGWSDWSCTPHFFSGNKFFWLALIIIAALVISKRAK